MCKQTESGGFHPIKTPNGSPLISECHSCPSRPSRLQYHTIQQPIVPTIHCNAYLNCRSQISSSPSGPSPIIVVGNTQSPLPFALRSTTEISCPSPRSTPRSNTRFHDGKQCDPQCCILSFGTMAGFHRQIRCRTLQRLNACLLVNAHRMRRLLGDGQCRCIQIRLTNLFTLLLKLLRVVCFSIQPSFDLVRFQTGEILKNPRPC